MTPDERLRGSAACDTGTLGCQQGRLSDRRGARHEICHADGSSVAADEISHSFVLFADPARKPTTRMARDGSGAMVETIDVADRQFAGPLTRTGASPGLRARKR